MPIYVAWDNPEKTVICQRFVQDWTLAEYYKSTLNLFDKVKVENHTIDYLIDFGKTSAQPTHFIIGASNLARIVPSNIGKIVVLHPNRFMQLSVEIFLRATPHLREKIYIVRNKEIAYNILENKKAATATS